MEDNKQAIRAARIRRRQAHATAMITARIPFCPSAQRVQAIASKEARICNIAAALEMGKSIHQIETAPKNNTRAIQYQRTLDNLMGAVDKVRQTFTS